MTIKLIVPSVKRNIFEAYWYGYGDVVDITDGEFPDTYTYTVDYGDDRYRAEYQDGRFASGLYFSRIEED